MFFLEDLETLKYPKLSTNDEDKLSYDYLTSILLFHFTQEKIDELNDKYDKKEEELNYYKNIIKSYLVFSNAKKLYK